MTPDPLLARLAFASVETCAISLIAFLALRWLKPEPRTAVLCWAVVLLKPLLSLVVGSPIAVVQIASPATGAPAPDVAPSAGSESDGVSTIATTVILRPGAGAARLDRAMPGETRQARGSIAPIPAGDVDAPASANSRSTVRDGATRRVEAGSALSLATILLGAWIVGVACMLGRSVRDRLRLQRLLARSRRADLATRRLARRLAPQLGTRPLPDLRVTRDLASPAFFGLWRPVVLLPAWIVDEPDQRMLRWALRHELAHFRQRDAWLLLLRELAQAVFFFHPVIWWSARRLEVALEFACDRAVAASPLRARAYAKQLLAIRERARGERALAFSGAFVARTRLLERVRELVERPFDLANRCAVVRRLLPCSLLIATLFGARAQQAAPPAAASSAAKPAAGNPAEGVELHGRVVDDAKKPVANATVRMLQYNELSRWIDRSAPRCLELARTTTDATGAFRLAAPANCSAIEDIELIAAAPGFIPCWKTSPRKGFVENRIEDLQNATLALSKDDLPIEGRVTDLEGRPVAGAAIRVTYAFTLDLPFEEALRYVESRHDPQSLYTFSSYGIGGASMTMREGSPAEVRSDAEGRFKIAGLGRDRIADLEILADGFERTSVGVCTHPGVDFAAIRRSTGSTAMMMQEEYGRAAPKPIYSPRFTHALAPEQRIAGVVVDAKTGDPIPDCEVLDYWHTHDDHDRTDAAGRFELRGLARTKKDHEIVARAPAGSDYLVGRIDVAPNASLAPIETRIALHRGVRIRGRVTDATTGEPVRRKVAFWPYVDNPNIDSLHWSDPNEGESTDADGRFQIVGLPGPGFVGVQIDGPGEYRYCASRAEDYHRKPGELGYVIAHGSMIDPHLFHEVRYVDQEAGSKEPEIELKLRRGNTLTLSVLDRDGRPVKQCQVFERGGLFGYHVHTEGPEVAIGCLEPGVERTVLLLDETSGGAASLELSGDEAGTRELRLEPCAWLSGRFVDEDGNALPYHELRLDPEISGPLARADAKGAFRIAVVPAIPYKVALYDRKETRFEPGESRDVGDIRVADSMLGMR